MHTLYLCYFGLREPLVQTQVLPYLREIQKAGDLRISILTFEPELNKKWSAAEITDQKNKLAAENIEWHCLPYHKTPTVPATLYDVVSGAMLVRRLIRSESIDVLHARSHVAAMIGAIAKITVRRKPKLIFDIRGFFPEEYTDAGIWKENGLIFKAVKSAEKWLLKKSDGFVVLTEKARGILFPESAATGFEKFGRPVEVIPCCANFERFVPAETAARDEARRRFGFAERYVITYVGSLGTWYLADEMADFMQAARDKDKSVFALILTQSAPEIMAEKLKARGFGEQDFLVKKVATDEIHEHLIAADLALSFIKPCYSKLSSSPTKIAEYLASGVPIVANSGVGDITEQIETDKIGVVIKDFNRKTYDEAFDQIKKLQNSIDMSAACQRSARKRFDLEKVGGKRYRSLYERLFAQSLTDKEFGQR